MKPLIKSHYGNLINHIFQILLITYLILLLIEQIFPGIVSVYLNLNYLLIITIIAGILDVFSEHNTIISKTTKKDYFLVFALGILGLIIIRYKTSDLGLLSWFISAIAGILIILLSILILEEE